MKLLTRLHQRALESSGEMQKRFAVWRKIDETLTAYIPLDDAEELIKRNDSRKPVSVVVPFSYATLETLLTYMTSAFLDGTIFRYDGASPEDIVGSAMLEKVIEVQTLRTKMALNLHTAFRDGYAYGFGAVSPYWDRRYGKKMVIAEGGWMSQIFGRVMNSGKRRVATDTILYEGNTLRNIDPYRSLPDPNVAIHEPQKGEFWGWVESTNYMKLLEMEKNGDNAIFNVKYLSEIAGQGGTSQFNRVRAESGRYSRVSTTTLGYTLATKPIDVVWMYVNLSPSEWELGSGDFPEKWLFGVAADKVIISARPMNLNHNMFPIAVCAPDSDGYSVSPVSRLEVVHGLQTTLDWLFSSHVSNVRKAINDMLVVDPSLINVPDLEDPAPGKLIRLRRAAWGKGVKDAVAQLNVHDITANHIQDSAYVTSLMKDVSGSVDSTMGIARKTSERVSATEARSVIGNALSRLGKSAKLVSFQLMFDLAYMLASHTQQLMSRDLYVNMTGVWEQDLSEEYGVDPSGRMKVSPMDISIDYDVVIKDGSVPDTGNSETWTQMFQILATNPMISQQFDMVRVFKHIARGLGAKDVNEFIARRPVRTAVVPNATVSREAQAGNLVPVEALGGEV
jgi:hypothetical protein